MATIREWTVSKPWAEPHCALGEGPFYEAETDSLRLVDIKKKQILYYSGITAPENRESVVAAPEVLQLDACPTVTADIAGVDPRERILVGVKHGLATLDRGAGGKYEMLVPFNQPHNERLRANDGYADPLGRFLLGSMTDFGLGPFQPEGMYMLPHTYVFFSAVFLYWKCVLTCPRRPVSVHKVFGRGPHPGPHDPQRHGLVARPADHVLYALADAGGLCV